MTAACRPAKSAARSTTKTRTTTGAAGPIRASTVVKCGGAVARLAERRLVASIAPMSQRMTKMTKRMEIMTMASIPTSTFAALAARKSVTRLTSAPGILISKLAKRQTRSTYESST